MKKLLLGLLIFSFTLPALAYKFDVNAGPIWNNWDAKAKCPNICADRRARWTGQWLTTEPGVNSICTCKRHRRHRWHRCWTRSFSAGPIWNNRHANRRCPYVCRAHNAVWNGQWRTVKFGQDSVCDCRKCN